MKRLLIRTVSLFLLLAFFADTCCYGLATLPASQNSSVRDSICWSFLTAHNKNPLDVARQASELLAKQNANIVFEKDNRTKRWVFRRSGMEIKVDLALNMVLGNIMNKEKRRSFLLALRGQETSAIEGALRSIIFNDKAIQESFVRNGIRCAFDYKKILIVPPYGDAAGGKVKYIQPHMGSEIVTYRLNREAEDVDARVYNPNLGSLRELYRLIKKEKFDVIAFSVLRTTLGRTLQMSARTHLLAPESMIVFGGYDVKFLPLEDLFASISCDVGVFDDGTALVKIMHSYGKKEDGSLVQRFGEIPNLIIREGDKLLKTPEADISMQNYDVYEDIPVMEPDLTHGKIYQHLNVSGLNPALPLDRIGRNPLSVYYGNLCKGNCVFCLLQKNTIHPPLPDEVIATLEKDFKGHDSLNFECPDVLAHNDSIRKLAARFKESRFASIPKKAPARVDNIGDGTILKEMAEAGFKLLSFGVESFNTGVLTKLHKRTTREQNIRALELSLKAGIRPGINLILYTPWDTIETVMDTIEQSLYFVERGAYLNIALRIHIRHGTERLGEKIVYRNYHYPGMRKSFKVPFAADIRDPKLRKVAHRAFNIYKRLSKTYAPFVANTICFKSLLNAKSFYLAYGEIYGFTHKINRSIQRVDRIIEKAIADMELTGKMGQELTFIYNEHDNMAVPVDDASSSLRMTEYVASKFPEELLNEIRGHRNRIELHSGPQSATEEYLRQLALDGGYSIRELPTTPQRIRRYYAVQKGEDKWYIISNSIGPNRELFVMQALSLHGYPEQKISVRQFPCDMRSSLLRSLGAYAGRIDKVMFAHNAGLVAEKFVQHVDAGARVVDTIHNDFIDARVVLTRDQKLVLFYEIEYTNGEQIKPVIEFCTDDVNMRGLGTKEIILYAACGAVGKDIHINDILCYSKVYRYGEEVESLIPNRVEPATLATFLPDVNVHRANFFTVPTVISSSASFIGKLKTENSAGIELELAHAVDAISARKDICFRAIYEVHDKPSAVDQTEKHDTIGNDVPGLRNRDKNRETLIGILHYLQFIWKTESAVRQDAKRAGYALKNIPPVVTSVNASRHGLVEAIRSSKDRSIVAIAGLSGTGKTTRISTQVKDIIYRDINERAAVISGDSFVFPKTARPTDARYPDNHFNIGLMRSALSDFKKGKRIGTRIYDPVIRGAIKFTEDELQIIRRDCSEALEVSCGIGKVRLLNEEMSKRYKNRMRNENSDIGFDEDGYMVEVINKDTKVLLFEVTVALVPPDMRELYDYAYFIWSPVNSRLVYLNEAKKKGERYRHYGEEEIGNRFSRMMRDEDSVVMPTTEFADIIVVNAERDSIEKSSEYDYGALFKADNKFLNTDLLQKIVQEILSEFEFGGIRCRGGIVGSAAYLPSSDGFVDVNHIGDIDISMEAIEKKDIDNSVRLKLREAFVQKLGEELSRYFSITIVSQENESTKSIRINDMPNADGFIQINVKNDSRVANALLTNMKNKMKFISGECSMTPDKRIKYYLSDVYYLSGKTVNFEQIKDEFLNALEIPIEEERKSCIKALCDKAAHMSSEVIAILQHGSDGELIDSISTRLCQELKSYRTSAMPREEIDAFDKLILLIKDKLLEGALYEIKYDAARLSSSQIDIVKSYVTLLRARSSNPENIKLYPCSSQNGSRESLIAIYCTGKDFKGEGHVDVSIPGGELKDYLLKIAGMVNIALASSSIPDNLSKEDVDKYRPVLNYINTQYEAILGEVLVIPSSPEDILKVIRKIVLGLPKSMQANLNQIEEYNRLVKEALFAA